MRQPEFAGSTRITCRRWFITEHRHGHKVEQRVLAKVQHLITLFASLQGVTILSPTQPARHAGIFTFTTGKTDQALYQHLVNRGVVCALRGGGIRFSPHFYTPDAKLDTLAQRVRDFIITAR